MNLQQVMAKSQKKIDSLHPVVREMAIEHVKRAYAAGVPILITHGLRTMEEQAAIYAKGRDAAGRVVDPKKVVSNARPGRSYHNYGLAWDMALLLPNGAASWDTVRDGDRDGLRDWYEAAAAGKSTGAEWGGDWERFVDMPHFQHTFGMSLNELQAGKRPPVAAAAPPAPDPLAVVTLNGKEIAKALIREGRTWIPLRIVGESVGAAIGWDDKAKLPTIDGKLMRPADVIYEKSVAHVPVRIVLESLGCIVAWDNAAKRVNITDKED